MTARNARRLGRSRSCDPCFEYGPAWAGCLKQLKLQTTADFARSEWQVSYFCLPIASCGKLASCARLRGVYSLTCKLVRPWSRGRPIRLGADAGRSRGDTPRVRAWRQSRHDSSLVHGAHTIVDGVRAEEQAGHFGAWPSSTTRTSGLSTWECKHNTRAPERPGSLPFITYVTGSFVNSTHLQPWPLSKIFHFSNETLTVYIVTDALSESPLHRMLVSYGCAWRRSTPAITLPKSCRDGCHYSWRSGMQKLDILRRALTLTLTLNLTRSNLSLTPLT